MNGRRGSPFHDTTRPPEDSSWLEQERLEELEYAEAAGRWADHLAEQSGVYPCDAAGPAYVMDWHGPGSGCDCGECGA